MYKKLFAALLTVILCLGGVALAALALESWEVSSAALTAEQAETIALESLGLTRDQVRFDRSELDYERGVQVWEVEFRYETTEYDFEIDATTGEILKQKTEQKKPETPAVPEPPAEPPKEETGELTEEEAVAIALAHAGLTEEQVTRLRVEKDIDRGITLYEIDFDYGGYEYEYEIRVSDGKILKQELDWDD